MAGNSNSKVVPSLTLLETLISPPCCIISRLQTANPSPGVSPVALKPGIEDVLNHVFRDSAAAIRYFNNRARDSRALDRTGRDADRSSRRRVANGIAGDVKDDLADCILVPENHKSSSEVENEIWTPACSAIGWTNSTPL
jgi:hypothetical protein